VHAAVVAANLGPILGAFHLHIVDDDLVDATGARGGRYPKTLTKCELPSSGLMSASAGWCFSPLARIFLRSIEWIAIVRESLCEAVERAGPKLGPRNTSGIFVRLQQPATMGEQAWVL
jgi:hypothetical protein